MKHRCRECTLLRVDCEGAVCEECAANMPAVSGGFQAANGFFSVTVTLEPPEQTVYSWSDCGAPPSSLMEYGEK